MDSRSPHILVVEDDPSLRRMICLALTEAGFDPIDAGDAEGALEAVGTLMAELAVVDIVLPGMSGYDLVKKLREHNPGITVIAVSGKHHPMEILEHDFDAVIAKPFDMERLVSTCIGMRRRSRRMRAVGGTPLPLPPEGADAGETSE